MLHHDLIAKSSTLKDGQMRSQQSLHALQNQLWYEASFLLRLFFVFTLSLMLAYGLRLWLSNQNFSLIQNQVVWSDSLIPNKLHAELTIQTKDEINYLQALTSESQSDWPFALSKASLTQVGQ